MTAISAVNFQKAKEYFAARGVALARLRDELRSVHRAVKEAVNGEAHMDGAYDKLYTKLREPRFPLRLLPPYAASNDAIFSRFVAGIPESWR